MSTLSLPFVLIIECTQFACGRCSLLLSRTFVFLQRGSSSNSLHIGLVTEAVTRV